MTDNALRDQISKTALIRTLGSQPRFLRRNLRHVLDRHEQELQRHSHASSVDREAYEQHRRGPKWELPSDAQIGAFMKRHREQAPHLKIKKLLLRAHEDRRRGFDDIVTPPKRRPSADNGLEWLPHPDDFRVQCQVRFCIYRWRSTKEIAHRSLIRADIVEHARDGHLSLFAIKLSKPFTIEEEALRVDMDGSDIVEGRYELEIAIQCRNSDSAVNLFSRLEAGGVQNHGEASFQKSEDVSVIKAVWGDLHLDLPYRGLPELPVEGELLGLRRGASKLSYGMETDMVWQGTKQFQLSQWNKTLRNAHVRQLPTPEVSDDLYFNQPPARSYKELTVKYHMRSNWQTRTVIIRTLRCILCRATVPQPSCQRLLLHYATTHDQYEVDFEEDDSDPNFRILTFWLKSVEKTWQPTAKAFDWEAPETPFDIEAHLRGDTKGVWLPTKPALDPKSLKKNGARFAKTLTGPLLLRRKRTKDLAAEDIPDLPAPKRRKHAIPLVPDVSFYRNGSKRILEQGTNVSDSEEDMDDSWLLQTQRRDLIRLGADESLREFEQLFCKRLDIERTSSDLSIREAIVRLARVNKAELCQHGLRERFKAKAKQLQVLRILSKDDVEYCMNLLASEAGSKISGKDPPQQQPFQPFGHRLLICRRNRGSAMRQTSARVSEYAKDEYDDLDSAKLHAHHLDIPAVISILDHKFTMIRDVDIIVLRSRDSATPLTSMDDWLPNLRRAEDRGGDLIFELHQHDSYIKLLNQLKPQQGVDAESGHESADPLREQPDKKPCSCGEVVKGLRGVICCGNPHCGRRFHLACTEVEKRMMSWRCPWCS